MKVKLRKKHHSGYTLIELMLVVVILAILSSILIPKFDLILVNAHQSTSKNNLGSVRTALSIYYSNHEGNWPLAGYPQGNLHYTQDGLSLTSILVPDYMPMIPVPQVFDRMPTFNGLDASYDDECRSLMSSNPPNDVFIVWGPPDYTPLVDSPFAYDNQQGLVYYPNGNYDVNNNFFYTW